MKRIAKLLVIALALVIPFIGVHADEKKTEEKNKVTIYFFRGQGCSHCAEAEAWFEELAKDEEYSKYYTIKDYEVWYSEDNAKLMDKVAKELGTEASGVPFIVIGKKYFSGFSQEMSGDIKKTIKDAYDSKDYKDVVNTLIKNDKKEAKEKESSFLPIVIVSGIALLTVIGLVFFTKEK